MYHVKFDPSEFAKIVPWLMINRAGLNVLIHPDTGDAVTDHAVNALWLGQKLELRIDILRQLTAA
jgi:DOPA 4,5-dioxygenase